MKLPLFKTLRGFCVLMGPLLIPPHFDSSGIFNETESSQEFERRLSKNDAS